MTRLRLYNSLHKQVEDFTPLENGTVRVYHCGPTVYKRPHLGNMRRFLFADMLHRSLEFLGFDVFEVTNITDVGHLTQDQIDQGDDKLEAEARKQHTTPQDIAKRVTEEYFQDLAMLHIRKSDHYPRATEHIREMQNLIGRLIERGHAYQTSSGVYFDVSSFSAYGQLSGNTLAALEAGARVEVHEDKKNPFDFALWIVDAAHLQQWDSPWGRGYPGWHIECSAMSMKYLGETFDIHTGGEDNKFPHHENEIAQSEGATGKLFARYWLHNGFLRLAGEKLAKREGEQITLSSLHERGYSPLAFRLLVFASHYRSPMDFSWEGLDEAQRQLDSFKQLLRRIRELATQEGRANESAVQEFRQALADDLNTPEALAAVQKYIRHANTILSGDRASENAQIVLATLWTFDHVLGVFSSLAEDLDTENAPEDVRSLARQREDARQRGDFSEADRLRQEIENLGFRVEDTSSGPRIVPI